MAFWIKDGAPWDTPTRMSPTKMQNRYGGTFRDGSGKPIAAAGWLLDPDVSGVGGTNGGRATAAYTVAKKYWKKGGANSIIEMDAGEKAAVDAAEDTAQKDATADTIDVDPYLKAFALIMLDEINILRAASVPPLAARTAGQLKTALRGKL